MLKNELVSALSDYMSPFISAYREGYSNQHVLVRLIEEWWKNLDGDYNDLLIAKLDNYGLDRNLLKYINLY